MPTRIDGKVAFITGAAKGQGRSHAVRLAAEGADIIAVDACGPVGGLPQNPASREDLAETAARVEELGRRIVARQADVRDFDSLRAAVDEGVDEFGRLDIVVANAGVAATPASSADISEFAWRELIDINLTGVWLSAKVAIPHLIQGGRGGSIVLISSAAGLRGHPNISSYVSAKHGVVGLMRSLARELGPHSIRVNSIHPTQVETDMIMNDATYKLFRPDLEHPTKDDIVAVSTEMHAMPVPWVQPEDVSNAVSFLVSADARYITGVPLPIDAGSLL